MAEFYRKKKKICQMWAGKSVDYKDPEILKKSSGFIRSELAKRINLRNTPELIFEIDDSIEYGAKIDSILKEILPEERK